MRTPCDACEQIHPEADMWRVTRRPDDEIVTMDVRTLADRDPQIIQVSGPEHLLICQTCWSHIAGWVGQMNSARKATA